MYPGIYKLLNIKPAEHKVVRQLFLVQFFLGVGTAFLFTSSLTIFLYNFDVHFIPRVYLLSAFLLLIANIGYSKLEHILSSRKLLQIIIGFSIISLMITWTGLTFLTTSWLPFLLAAWNLVIFTLIGYAFWGMAAIIFNVRESKRIFSVVGSGDIPAKLIGYALVPVLTPYIGVQNLFWFSVLAFAAAYYFLLRFQNQAIDKQTQDHEQERRVENVQDSSFIERYFHNKLIFFISIFSLIGFTIYALIDYTLLVEMKSRFKSSPELAIFIGVFFAIGRILAIFFKLLFSSRVISLLGLANSLLIAPLVLLLITSVLLLPGEGEMMVFYTFGIMVLLSEVLKSAVQEPAFFVLFQPLEPLVRLKGHLIAKGYMLPFALLGSGIFLLLCDQFLGGISIIFIAQVLIGLIFTWIGSIYLIKKQYLHTLIAAIKKGWFTGTELFLNDAPVRELLLHKSGNNDPKDIILALKLLERSGYLKLEELLKEKFHSAFSEVRKFALNRLILLGYKDVLPLVKEQLQSNPDAESEPILLKAYYYLIPSITAEDKKALSTLDDESYRFAIVGLLLRKESEAHAVAFEALENLVSNSSDVKAQQLALDIIYEAPYRGFGQLLENLLASSSDELCKRTIETVGKVGVYSLLGKVIKTSIERKTALALQKSLVLFGDHVFASSELDHTKLPVPTVKNILLAAGKVKGDSSTKYLLDMLAKGWPTPDDILESLWRKQAILGKADKSRLNVWLNKKLNSSRLKVEACQVVREKPALMLLADALTREIRHDMQKLLKGLALCYDRNQIDRVMKLLEIGEQVRVANAIEILEHLIPKRYFMQIDLLLDFLQDVPETKMQHEIHQETDISAVLSDIIKDEHMQCSVWTRSVACYLLPVAGVQSLQQILAPNNQLPEDNIFQETREYVLSSTS